MSVNFRRVRITLYDSNDQKGMTTVKEPDMNTPIQNFMKGMNSKVAKDLDLSEAFFRPTSLLIIETGIKLTNQSLPINGPEDPEDS